MGVPPALTEAAEWVSSGPLVHQDREFQIPVLDRLVLGFYRYRRVDRPAAVTIKLDRYRQGAWSSATAPTM